MHNPLVVAAALLGCVAGVAVGPRKSVSAPATPDRREAEEFFESRVRPVFVEKCGSCHSGAVRQSGLDLGSREGLVRGGRRGPAITPGKAESSLLLRSLRRQGPLKMPPGGPLSPLEIAAVEQWIASGAAWPEKTGSAPSAAGHWAFRPVRRPAVPGGRRRDWARNPVDAFLLAAMEAKGLQPAPEADRRTLIRRITYDLHGLPPAPEEVDAFLADTSPEAWEKVVDRLLASPRYGERWGRHWLDVARYSDTRGYVYSGQRRYPFAYTYRDWVIRALNEDLPYDRFLSLQVAGDCLPDTRAEDLAALGFLTLGRRFVNMQHDVIDDRMDVVFRGTQALTVGCARCHDHKYDPIPTRDYYSLYGVFAGSTEKQVRLGPDPEAGAAYARYAEELRKRESALAAAMEKRRAELSERLRSQVAAYLERVPEAEKLAGEEFYIIMGPDDVNPIVVRAWRAYIDRHRETHPVWGPWRRFAALAGSGGEGCARLAAEVAADDRYHPAVRAALAGQPVTAMKDVARRYGALLAGVHRDRKAPAPGADVLLRELDADGTPCTIPPLRITDLEYYFDEKTRNELNELQGKVDSWHIEQAAVAPPQALIPEELAPQPNPRVFVRGNPSRKGEEVPRQFLAVLSGADRQPFRTGNGRAELARALVDRRNPLTARVIVNRLWLGHFGAGLVRTPSDFGLRSEPPTHPELLDWLASELMDRRWSLKAMHRLMLTSAAYRQSSHPAGPGAARAVEADPENRLLWRALRRRLDWEAVRDTLLAVSGELDTTAGGPPVDLFSRPFSRRRSVYGLIDRQNLPGTLRIFDFANPDRHSPQRHVTTSPQQALFLLNSPFVTERARKLAVPEDGRERHARELYRRLFGREPSRHEVRLAADFVRNAPATPGGDLSWSYGWGSVEQNRTRFNILPHFSGTAWQGGEKWPDPELGWVRLTAGGGHAGNDARHAAIRRWTAPRRLTVRIAGLLRHASAQGDGVRGRLLSSRAGPLGEWTSHNGSAETAVASLVLERDETLDFIVDCRESVSFDEFEWAPDITEQEGKGAWSAAAGFGGPALSPWEQYAQALLLTNELAFVD